MFLHDGISDSQTQTSALPSILRGEEWFEDSRLGIFWNSWPIILDFE